MVAVKVAKHMLVLRTHTRIVLAQAVAARLSRCPRGHAPGPDINNTILGARWCGGLHLRLRWRMARFPRVARWRRSWLRSWLLYLRLRLFLRLHWRLRSCWRLRLGWLGWSCPCWELAHRSVPRTHPHFHPHPIPRPHIMYPRRVARRTRSTPRRRSPCHHIPIHSPIPASHPAVHPDRPAVGGSSPVPAPALSPLHVPPVPQMLRMLRVPRTPRTPRTPCRLGSPRRHHLGHRRYRPRASSRDNGRDCVHWCSYL